jgi:hypothetical protein
LGFVKEFLSHRDKKVGAMWGANNWRELRPDQPHTIHDKIQIRTRLKGYFQGVDSRKCIKCVLNRPKTKNPGKITYRDIVGSVGSPART